MPLTFVDLNDGVGLIRADNIICVCQDHHLCLYNSCFHAGKTFFGSRNHAGAGHWLLPVWNPSTLHFGWERRRGSGPLATPRVESHPEVTEAAARATRCLSVSLSLCRSVSLSPCLPVSPSLCLSVFPCYTSTFVMLQRHMRR